MDRAEELARKLSARVKRTGTGWLTLCPAHNDHEPSLHISPAPDRTSGFVAHCFAGCPWEVLGPILRGYAIEGVPVKEGGRAGTGEGEPRSERRWAGAQTPNSEPALYNADLGSPVRRWPYRTPGGGIWLYVARYAPNEEERRPFRPWTWWRRNEAKPPRCELGYPPEGEPRYPYRADVLAQGRLGAPVIVVEGESTSEAAMTLFEGCEGTTWAGGCSMVTTTEWEVLRKRRVVVVPDEDRAGRHAMGHVARTLMRLGTGCTWVEGAQALGMGDVHRGWDIEEPLKGAGDEEREALRSRVRAWRRRLGAHHPLALRGRSTG